MTPPRPGSGLHRFACLVAAATFCLLIAGGLVTSTGSGLAVPDWPLSYGTFFPEMVGGVFYEHGHRMIAGTVALLTLALAVALQWREPRRGVRILGWVAVGAVLLQAILGGITVLWLLPTPVSVAHACLGQIFFCLIATIALVTSPSWREGVSAADAPPPASRAVFLATAGALFVQLVLGAWMRHDGAGLAIPTFPLAFGRLIPPFDNPGVAIHFAHRVWALVVTACVLASAFRVVRHHRGDRPLAAPGLRMTLLLPVQITLGAYTVLTAKGVAVATTHLAFGALLLAASVILCVQSETRRVAAKVPPRTGWVPGAEPA